MEPSRQERDISKAIERIERRKMRAKARGRRSEWLGLGMMGMIGWSVTLPTLLATVAGIWLDKHYRQSFSWTLTLLLAGVTIGSMVAYNRISRERDHIENESNDPDHEKDHSKKTD